MWTTPILSTNYQQLVHNFEPVIRYSPKPFRHLSTLSTYLLLLLFSTSAAKKSKEACGNVHISEILYLTANQEVGRMPLSI